MSSHTNNRNDSPAKLEPKGHTLAYQMHHLPSFRQVDPEIAPSSTLTRIERSIRVRLEVDIERTPLFNERFFDLAREILRYGHDLDMRMTAFRAQSSDLKHDGHCSVLRVEGLQRSLVSRDRSINQYKVEAVHSSLTCPSLQ